MPQEDTATPAARTGSDFGIFSRRSGRGGSDAGVIIAGTLSLIWLALVGGFFLVAEKDPASAGPMTTLMVLVAIVVPIALIWIATITLRAAHDVRAESARLQSAVDAMRQAYIAQGQGGAARLSVEKRLEEIAAAARQAESAIATFASQREAEAAAAAPKPALSAQPAAKPALSATPAPEDAQPNLALGNLDQPPPQPISVTDFIRALNFPDNAGDRDGFKALRSALADPSIQRLIRSAQDALTLLSQDGIYMDDLRPDRARPELWRRFAQGERGRAMAALGGIHDRSSLALTSARMRQDTVFRDTAHHFLRLFDKTFSAFEKNATDAEIAALSDTRTARAFMLLGRVTGMFD